MEITKTTSMPAAAFVVAHGWPMPEFEQTSPGRFTFVFRNATKLLQGYFSGETVAARDFYRALQEIRFAVNRAKNGGAR